MPSAYTHFLVARQSLNALQPRIQEKISPYLPLYYLGAQGADFCFFYKYLSKKNANLGSYLHRAGGYIAFETIHRAAAQSPALFAYAAGYITHYAADVILHPYVYAVSKQSTWTHTRIESALDFEYGKQYAKPAKEDFKRYFKPCLSRENKEELFTLYQDIAKTCNFPPLVKPAFYRAISYFNAYLPLSFALLTYPRAPLMVSAFGKEYPQKISSLFLSICARARMLTREFLQTIETATPLPKFLFDKNFLTGKTIK